MDDPSLYACPFCGARATRGLNTPIGERAWACDSKGRARDFFTDVGTRSWSYLNQSPDCVERQWS